MTPPVEKQMEMGLNSRHWQQFTIRENPPTPYPGSMSMGVSPQAQRSTQTVGKALLIPKFSSQYLPQYRV